MTRRGLFAAIAAVVPFAQPKPTVRLRMVIRPNGDVELLNTDGSVYVLRGTE